MTCHYRFWKVIFSLFSLSLSLLKSDFFTFFIFIFAFEMWKNHFSTFTFAFEKWKNHFSTFPEKVLKWKNWKAKVKSESDYFSRSNVCMWLILFCLKSSCLSINILFNCDFSWFLLWNFLKNQSKRFSLFSSYF